MPFHSRQPTETRNGDKESVDNVVIIITTFTCANASRNGDVVGGWKNGVPEEGVLVVGDVVAVVVVVVVVSSLSSLSSS